MKSFLLEERRLKPPFDLRLIAVRPDLADAAVKGLFVARRFAEPLPARCVVPFTPILLTPGSDKTSELLLGERFNVLDISDGWAWGWCAHDHYVGYIAAAALGEASPHEEFPAGDTIEAALRFLDMPYLLSGRGGAGIDCSGLVQRAFAAVGVSLPRDSDMQQALGIPLAADNQLLRGDLIGFAGHVGLMMDADLLIHATAHWGRTLVEPLADVTSRTAITSRARLSDSRS